MAKPTATIKVGVDDKSATAGLKRLVRNFKRSATEINQSLELLRKAWGLVSGAIGAVTNQLGEFISLSIEQDRVERRAVAALQLRGKFTRESLNDLQAFNSALQQRLGFGDEELLQLQGTLAAMGVKKTALKEATKATIGLAEATGQDLKAAGLVVAKALGGQTSALTRYGIEAKTVGEAQKKLTQLFKVAEAQAGSLATQVRLYKANTGDLKETLGAAVTQSGVVVNGLKRLNQAAFDLVKFFDSTKGRKAINDFFGGMLRMIAKSIQALAGMIKLFQDLQVVSEWAVRRGKGNPLEAARLFSLGMEVAAKQSGGPLVTSLGEFAGDLVTASKSGLVNPGGNIFGGGGGGGGGGGRIGGRRGQSDLARKDDEAVKRTKEMIEHMKKLDAEDVARMAAHNKAEKDFQDDRLKSTGDFIQDLLKMQRDSVFAQEKVKNTLQSMWSDMALMGIQAFAGMVSGITTALATGTEDIAGAIGKLFGALLQQIGSTLIMMGTILGVLAIFGGATAGYAAAFMGAGIIATAAGAAISSGGPAGGARTSASPTNKTGARGNRAPSSFHGPRGPSPIPIGAGFTSGGAGSGSTKIFNITFGRTFLHGSPAELGRAVRESLREADRLEGL